MHLARIWLASGSHLARTMFGPIHLLRVRNMISIPTSRPNSDDADSGKSGIVETQRTGRFHISDSNGNGLVALKIVMPPLEKPRLSRGFSMFRCNQRSLGWMGSNHWSLTWIASNSDGPTH
jgi:hypothetical protein